MTGMLKKKSERDHLFDNTRLINKPLNIGQKETNSPLARQSSTTRES